MSRVPSRPARHGVRTVASSPAVAGFRPSGAALAVAALFALHGTAVVAQSVPVGAIHGTATFARDGANLRVTTTNGAGSSHSAINWQTFNVPGGSTTHFQQPGAASTSINRVIGPRPNAAVPNISEIFGTLSSNGRLVLVNPEGIAVGKGAMVNTAGFTASTLMMNEADAIAGRLLFSGGAGATLKVEGRILASGGDVVLIGSQVQVGTGAVIETDGAAILAAGEKVEVTGRGLEGILMQVQAGNEAVNLGSLKGDAVGIFAGTLKHSGVIQAQAVTAEGGKVVLRAADGDAMVSGTITAAAANGKGGQVDVLGERVGLLAGAAIDASGAAGGGQVRIGGDYQGQNPDVPNAKAVYVDAQASIRADATQQGDGGRVIVWSDDVTRMRGQISARGGADGGNGGFAEVSGKTYLEYTGRTDLRAPQGVVGILLLDPNDITVTVAGPTDTSTGSVFAGGPASATIKEQDLKNQLALSSVIVATNGGSGGTGKITVASDVDINWSADTVLGLQADSDIDLQGKITAMGSLAAVSLRATGSIVQGAGSVIAVPQMTVRADNGSIGLTGANKIGKVAGQTTNGGNLSITNAQSLIVGAVYTPYGGEYQGLNAGAGTVTVKTSAGDITVDPGVAVTGNAAALQAEGLTPAGEGASDLIVAGRVAGDKGAVLLRATRDVSIQGLEATTDGDLTIDAGRDLSIATTGVGNTTIEGGASLTAGAAGNVTVGTREASSSQPFVSMQSLGDVKITAGGKASFGLLATPTQPFPSSVGVIGGSVLVKAGQDAAFSLDTALVADIGTLTVLAGGSIGGAGSFVTFGSSDPTGTEGRIHLSAASGSISFGVVDSAALADASFPGFVHGGHVFLDAATSVSGTFVDASGDSFVGDGSSATGNGGIVQIHAAGGGLSVQQIVSRGGNAPEASGLAGGMGGTVFIAASGNISLVNSSGEYSVIVDGGGSDAGTGGSAGQIHLAAGGTIEARSLTTSESSGSGLSARGGVGGSSSTDTGGAGGNGGFIVVSGSTSGADLLINNSLGLDATGGQGGNGADGGGTGGQGGVLSVFANNGRVVLDNPYIRAGGGAGGFDSDSPAQASSGAMGSFTAMGSLVEVATGVVLNDVVWTNSSIVKMAGSSFVSGSGFFLNASDVNLFDSASLSPTGGVINAGRLSAFGSANRASLTVNTGLVEVVGSAALDAPVFFDNAGTVKVDGTLRIGSSGGLVFTDCSLCFTAAAGTFTNQSSGVLTGNGNIIVDGGLGTVDNFGTIAPGGMGSVGRLTLTGNLVMESSAVYAADIRNTGSHDSLQVTGTATTGGNFAVTYLPDTAFNTGDSFRMIQSASLGGTLPGDDKEELVAATSGNDLLLTAVAPFPAAPAPTPAPASPPPAPEQEAAAQQSNTQTATFAQLFIQEAQRQQQEEARENEIGKDDIVVTETACK